MADDGPVPFLIIEAGECWLDLFPEVLQFLRIRKEGPLVQDTTGPFAGCVRDEQAPAAVIAADVRAGIVHRAPCLSFRIKPEERACIRQSLKTAFVLIEGIFVRIHPDFLYIAGIVVVYDKGVVPPVFCNCVDEFHVAAAVAALTAFTGDGGIPPEILAVLLRSQSLFEWFLTLHDKIHVFVSLLSEEKGKREKKKLADSHLLRLII